MGLISNVLNILGSQLLSSGDCFRRPDYHISGNQRHQSPYAYKRIREVHDESIGIIGCGRIAQVRHIPEYADHRDARLDAFYDLNPERARELAGTYGRPSL